MAIVMAKSIPKPRAAKTSRPAVPGQPSPTVAAVAHALISQQYDCMIRQESDVLADQDPECLHQMRVGSRRLCTALQVFRQTVKLPKAVREKPVRALTKTLGRLRDLDVQIAAIREQYYPDVNRTEQKHLTKLLTALDRQRGKALAAVVAALTHSSYHQLKDTYKDWLHDPRYTAIAALPLTLVLPELLSPLLANLLLHPAWLIPIGDISQTSSPVLHDLRKTCKAVRYQAEFFTPFYGSAFQDWLKELKQLQEDLGQVQDAWVLRQLIRDELGEATQLPELEKALQTRQLAALVNWETLRHHYLNFDCRCRLHQMILSPSMPRHKTSFN